LQAQRGELQAQRGELQAQRAELKAMRIRLDLIDRSLADVVATTTATADAVTGLTARSTRGPSKCTGRWRPTWKWCCRRSSIAHESGAARANGIVAPRVSQCVP
jgi:hypothetical protein